MMPPILSSGVPRVLVSYSPPTLLYNALFPESTDKILFFKLSKIKVFFHGFLSVQVLPQVFLVLLLLYHINEITTTSFK
jgi:hypothetical protein